MLGGAFIRCPRGATAIEYAFIASLVSIVRIPTEVALDSGMMSPGIPI